MSEDDECRDTCISCGAVVDHYLGCPEDPDPNYEAEVQAQRDLLATLEGECDCGDVQAHIQHI